MTPGEPDELQSYPNIAEQLPRCGRTDAPRDEIRPKYDQDWPTVLAKSWPALPKAGPHIKCQPDLATLGPALAKFGRVWPMFGNAWSSSAKVVPMLDKAANVGQWRPTSGKVKHFGTRRHHWAIFVEGGQNVSALARSHAPK